MNIEKVKVKNYRLLKDFELNIKKDLSLIVGKNNCGKTSIITILNKLLNSDSRSAHFKWDDFNLEFQGKLYNSLSNSGNEDFTDGISMTLFINYSEEDSYLNIQKFMMDLNPANNTIVLEFRYFCPQDRYEMLKATLEKNNEDNKDSEDKEEKFSKFMRKNVNNYFILKVYSRGYDSKSNTIIDSLVSEVEQTSEIKKLINCHVIKANRDASNQTNDHSLSNLSAKYYELKKPDLEIQNPNPEIEVSSNIEIFDKLNQIILDADNQLNKIYNGDLSATDKDKQHGIFTHIINNIKKFGGVAGETMISIMSSIESKELLRDNTKLHYEHDGKYLPENYNGLGYLNLIGMIFEIETAIASFSGKDSETSADINLLFIEEPEAHTHPQLQYIFIQNIKDLIEEKRTDLNLNIQTLLTTHSSHIVADCNFDDIRYLKRIKKQNKQTIASMNFEQLSAEYECECKKQPCDKEKCVKKSFNFIKQHLTLSRSELFFADKVIFIEGDTERLLLPAMMRKVDQENNDKTLPLLSQNISVIEVGAYSHKFRKLIAFLGLKALVITDIDGTKKEATKDKDGKIKTSKKTGETIYSKVACPSAEAKYTSNHALINFFDLDDSDEHFNHLISMESKKKIVDGALRVAYQTEENNYLARSFEDSFIALNLDYIKRNVDAFEQGLKNRENFNASNLDYYELANECICKKSSFATELLYNEANSEDKWEIPKYIKEGLEWLRKV
ncbi:MAG: ATP-dependent endonuclease [Oscillospiraceae bacterium]|nr:ATP-dependent endonuclease [Oscillospiraceae bacterium]